MADFNRSFKWLNEEEPVGATPLDPDECEGLLHKHIETRAELNELENANIIQGLLWLRKQKNLSHDSLLSRDFILRLHRQLLGDTWEWAGRFRTRESNLGCDPLVIETNLHNLLEDIKCWIEFQHYPTLELSARIQHRLVQIHPFVNGNGRHTRIITDCVRQHLLKLPPLTWANGNLDQQNDERKAYIDCLRKADVGDYQALVNYLVDKGNTT